MVIHRIIADAAGVHKQGLRTEDAELAERWAREAPANAQARGTIMEPVVVDFEPAHGDAHGHELICSVGRMHADIVRGKDGKHEVRALYHYPAAAPDDTSGMFNALLTKRQWVKIPTVASKRLRTLRND
ncbi:MAG: hypothetical protein IJI03_12360 [Rudaea sp.]|nr:hypothetical protein [Rudaea sp.]